MSRSTGVKCYQPLQVEQQQIVGFLWAMEAMRLPKGSIGDSYSADNHIGAVIGEGDLELASRLVRAGNDHAKAMRGVLVYLKLNMQVGFMIEFETYRAGVECLSTSSAMHNELKFLEGPHLAEQKQLNLPGKVYTRSLVISYQALRAMYKARRLHRHPDWRIFCQWIETLPYAHELITV